MKGSFYGGEARIDVIVVGPAGYRKTVRAVIDTGSSGWLTLPKSDIDELGLPKTGFVRAALANGSEATFDTYAGSVVWNRRTMMIEIEQAETTPLVGVSLMKGCELRIEVWLGGSVRINPRRKRKGRG